jgi:hypothetical protein
MFPPVLHVLKRAFMRLITRRDGFVQMLVLRLDDLVGAISADSPDASPVLLKFAIDYIE